MDVLFTVDTEVHAINKDWRCDGLESEVNRDIEGIVGTRRVGLDYQLELFSKYGIKATFMVEPLFSAMPGVAEGVLESVVQRIQGAGHETQLHLHCEWIAHYPSSVLDIPYRGYLQRSYSTSEQQAIVRFGSALLDDCGVRDLVAFRAGGYAAFY